jgi:ATP-dependent DNA helicase RecG
MNHFLSTPIEYLKGVGTAKGELLRKEYSIHTFSDLLYHFPYKYIDKRKVYKVSEIGAGATFVQLEGKITNIRVSGSARKKRLSATFSDETGSAEMVWFKGVKWIEEILRKNTHWVIFGKPTFFNGKLNFAHPELSQPSDLKKASGFSPLYHTTEKSKARKLDSKGFRQLLSHLVNHEKWFVPDFFESDFTTKQELVLRAEALRWIHFPQSSEQLQAALFRLKFEEFFMLQVKLAHRKQMRQKDLKGLPFTSAGTYLEPFYHEVLPFQLTNAQKRVFKEIYNDCKTGYQMNRLLQGDVGSGKSIVAFMTLLLAIGNGYQGTIMAPTEILATQLHDQFSAFAEHLNLTAVLLTGSTPKKKRETIHEQLLDGSANILVGTHALIEDKVKMKNQGMVVIDEQHRFGVAQRAKLWAKSASIPHILIMTATPIPRTLAMSLYGDLDVSVIDELPAGRKPIKTAHRYDANRLRVWGFMKEEIKKGRQVYVVFPLIEDSETLDFKNLTDGFDDIAYFFPRPEYQLDILHGKMKPKEKEFVMNRFKNGETQILVSTTVIEVGINVPNASVMVIESAERFGLSQLHQLRGRVGRGGDQSFCVLMTKEKLSETARKRMRAMVSTTDGFELAELDMKLRGPGDIEGTQQSGLIDLKVADVNHDQNILQKARQAAFKMIDEDPGLNLQKHKDLKEYLKNSGKLTDWGRVS